MHKTYFVKNDYLCAIKNIEIMSVIDEFGIFALRENFLTTIFSHHDQFAIDGFYFFYFKGNRNFLGDIIVV